MAGIFGDMEIRTHLEMVIIRGFAQFDATHCLHAIVFPVLVLLLDVLLVPYFASRLLCLVLPQSYLLRTVLIRFSVHLYVTVRIILYVSYNVVKNLVKLHNEVRDSKYLVGTKLTNRVLHK